MVERTKEVIHIIFLSVCTTTTRHLTEKVLLGRQGIHVLLRVKYVIEVYIIVAPEGIMGFLEVVSHVVSCGNLSFPLVIFLIKYGDKIINF